MWPANLDTASAARRVAWVSTEMIDAPVWVVWIAAWLVRLAPKNRRV